MRLKQNLVHLPAGCDIVTFVQHDGKPPEYAASDNRQLTIGQLHEAYARSQKHKREQTTLDGIQLHFKHLTRILGSNRLIPALTRADLQAYADKRADEWIDPNIHRRARRDKFSQKPPRANRNPPPSAKEDKPLRHPSPATVKKEIISLRTAWNWARRHLTLAVEFPGNGLDFAKIEEELPFMTWEEANRRIVAGDPADCVWDCLYLRPNEVVEVLKWVKQRPISPWVYPMFCLVAYTGARRSEIVRVLPSDIDLANEVITIREKKRVKKKNSTRRVPLTPFLKEVLADWMKSRANGRTFFCKPDRREIDPREAHNYFQRALRTSKWCVLKGYHVFRHSFISALASSGVDQRIIDEFVGHQTEEQRRRYRHLYPSTKHEAIKKVFG